MSTDIARRCMEASKRNEIVILTVTNATDEDVDLLEGAALELSEGVDWKINGQFPVLSPDVLDTIRLALMARVDDATGYLISDSHMAPFQKAAQLRAAYWAGELWQIERARRALGLED